MAPKFTASFLKAIEGIKIAGGLFGGVTHYKLNLRFDEAQGPLLLVNQTGKAAAAIDKVLDILYENSIEWERPKKADRSVQMYKG